MTGVYLETGTKRVFACAVDWPGWCRSGRGEEQALAALATAASRYAVVPALASVTFDPVHKVDCIEIAERVTGTSATDFGALDVAPALDGEPGTAHANTRLVPASRYTPVTGTIFPGVTGQRYSCRNSRMRQGSTRASGVSRARW